MQINFIVKRSHRAAETDLIELEDGSLLAALRGDENFRTHLHFPRSGDHGENW
ncbi:MAG: sialidase family protein [Abditibacteriaceae bacterium]